ncbi:MAG TPA: hypothetical protein VHG71_02860 [Verrucomicrobiae bacterium]|nr:hypothetical protein [Verrucomicrobiae bacterium]
MRDLVIKFYLPHLHESKSDGRRILEMICDLMPELMPEFYNSCQPINKQFALDKLDIALEDWGDSFLWKRKKPSVDGMVTFGSAHPRRPFHTSLILEAKPENVDSKKLTRFVQEFSKTFRPDIGLIHVFPKIERRNRQPILHISSFILRESLPNLYWATVFGAPYVKLFGKERLLSTPAAVVKELADDLVYIQLTDDVMDNRKQPEKVEAAREAAKKHLDSNAFFNSQRSPNFVYRKPEFHIVE